MIHESSVLSKSYHPLIGLSTNHKDNTSCVAEAYYQAIVQSGGLPVLLPVMADESLLEATIEHLDGLLLTGGGDIDPAFFGEQPIPQLGTVDRYRDDYDVTLIQLAARRQMPMLAICRGMQIVNVVFGGDLYQDLAAQYNPSAQSHDQSEPRNKPTHGVTLANDTKIARIMGVTSIQVNSLHHQAVHRVAKGFVCSGWSLDGLAEAIEAPHYPIIGVQWHPEHLAMAGRSEHTALFDWLIAEARLYSHARHLHERMLSIDSHTDTPMVWTPTTNLGHRSDEAKVDFVKMREGRLDAVCMVAYIPQQTLSDDSRQAATAMATDILQRIRRQVEQNCTIAALCTTPADICAAKQQQRCAIVPAIENGFAIGTDIMQLERFRDLGACYITLCHNGDNDICDSACRSVHTHGGLSAFGREVVQRMNRLGLIIDLSHAAESTFWDVLRLSTKPVVATHSSARALCDHPRNLTDNQLHALAEHGGVCQVCLYSDFLAADGKADIETVMRHIDHIVQVAGIDHVGIGSDFDGGTELPGCSACNEMIALTVALLRRGYTDSDIAKIWGGNFLRLMTEVQQSGH